MQSKSAGHDEPLKPSASQPDRLIRAGRNRTTASIRTATGAILETDPKTRDLGGSAGTVEVTQAIRNALTTSAIAA
jgi:isocitrate/isopropylmalate dehydrogenase